MTTLPGGSFLSKHLGFCSAAFLVHSNRSESHFRLVHTKLIWKDNNLHAKSAWQVWALPLSFPFRSVSALFVTADWPHLRMQRECRLLRGPIFVTITLSFPSLSAIQELGRRLIHSGVKKIKLVILNSQGRPPFSLSLPSFLLSAFFLYSFSSIFFLLPASSLYSSPLLTSFSFPHFSSSFLFCFLPLSPSFNIACPSLLPAFKLLPFTS